MEQRSLRSKVEGMDKHITAIVESIWPTLPEVRDGVTPSSPCGKILRSLYFPAMKYRELEIPEASQRTFEWILQGPQSRLKRHQ